MYPLKVLFDTCTIIHLLNENAELHANALACYCGIKKENGSLLVSPFSVDEYGVKDDPARIFQLGVTVPPYAVEHAKKAADLLKLTGNRDLRHHTNDRAFIATDTRIIAQAVIEQVDYILTADRNTFLKTFHRLEEQRKISHIKAISLWSDPLKEMNIMPTSDFA